LVYIRKKIELFTVIRQGKLDEVKKIIERKPELANRGHYAELYPGLSNKSMFLDDFIPGDETDKDRNRNLRMFMQTYFKSRNLQI